MGNLLKGEKARLNYATMEIVFEDPRKSFDANNPIFGSVNV